MKKMLFIVVLILLVLVLVGCSNHRFIDVPEPEVEEDGYTSIQTDVSAPKAIESTEIMSFWCCFSTLAYDETDELGNSVYALNARVTDDIVTCRYRSSSDNTDISFSADTSFMEELQKIAADHDLAQYNGIYSETKGLPDMYGADLTVDYASGEWISAYNNDDNYLSFEAMAALKSLFLEASSKAEAE